MGVTIVTDSCCDFPQEVLNQYGILSVPLGVTINGVDYLDKLTISVDEFYQKMANCEELPKTSAPPVGLVQETVDQVMQSGNDMVAVMLSAGLSCTFSTMQLICQQTNPQKCFAFDSGFATFAEGLLAIEAAKMAQAGQSAQSILKELVHLRERMELIAVFGDLTNLKKGGRISPLQAALGMALNIKPVLDIREGQMNVVERIRSMKKCYQFMLERFDAYGRDCSLPMALGNACAAQEMDVFGALLKEHTDFSNVFVSEVGATIGTHTGPGCVGIAWFKK